MAWGALATGARAATGSTGQGLSLMQESFSRDHAGRAAARHLQHGARPAGLLPGDARRRARRLPPHRARAAGRQRGASSSRSSRSTSPTSGATRCSSTATTCSRTRRRRSTIEPLDVPGAAGQGLGGRRLARRAPGESRVVTPLGVGKVGQRALGQEGKAQYIATKIAADGARGARRDRLHSTTPRPWSSRSARRRKFVQYAIEQLRAEGDRRSATCGRSRCGRSRTTRCATRPRAARARRRLRAVRGPDDRRRAHRRCRARAGRRSSAASRPTTPASASGRCSTSTIIARTHPRAAPRTRAAADPRLRRVQLRAAAHQQEATR